MQFSSMENLQVVVILAFIGFQAFNLADGRRCCRSRPMQSCNPLPSILNGEAVLNVAGVARPGDTATVQCLAGYETDGVVTLTCNSNQIWTPEVQDPCNPACDSIACSGCCPPGEWQDSTEACVGNCTGGIPGYGGPDYTVHDKMEVLCPNSAQILADLCQCLATCLAIPDCRTATYYNSEGRCYLSACDPNQNIIDPSDVPVFNVGVEDATLYIRNCASP